MGVLDDAIREHLELKRQHGAPDEEIARAEAEALGPARREPALAPEVIEEQAAAAELTEPAPLPGDETELLPPEAVPAAPEAAPPPPEGAVPEADLAPPPAVYDDVEQVDPAPLEHPAAPSQPAPGPAEDDPLAPPDTDFEPDEVPADEALGGDTAVYEPRSPDAPLPPSDPEPGAAPPPALPPDEPDADVGGDEHDKLWFEQKPSRDPDFDE